MRKREKILRERPFAWVALGVLALAIGMLNGVVFPAPRLSLLVALIPLGLLALTVGVIGYVRNSRQQNR